MTRARWLYNKNLNTVISENMYVWILYFYVTSSWSWSCSFSPAISAAWVWISSSCKVWIFSLIKARQVCRPLHAHAHVTVHEINSWIIAPFHQVVWKVWLFPRQTSFFHRWTAQRPQETHYPQKQENQSWMSYQKLRIVCVDLWT